MSELSAPMGKLASLLEDIAAGKFHPDAPLGLQWGPAPHQPLPLQLPARPCAARGPAADGDEAAPAASPRPQQARWDADAPVPAGGAGPASPGAAPSPPAGTPRGDQSANEAWESRLGFLVSDQLKLSRPQYVHVAVVAPAVDPKRRRTARLRVQSPHGVVTTLCDNTLQSAAWAQKCPLGVDILPCPVCRARVAS